MTTHSWDSYSLLTILMTSLVVAIVGTLILVVKSLCAFSQTGPQIREEILRNYSTYSGWALARLAAWSCVLLIWMGLIGSLSYLGATLITHTSVSLPGAFVAAALGILLITTLQFVHHLLHLPSSLMVSSHYSMARLYPLWRQLTVSRIRWLRLVILAVVIVPIFLALRMLAIAQEWIELVLLGGLACVLAAPYIWATRPLFARPKSAHHNDREKPNILMIGSDTLRADRLGALGYQRTITPFLDTLAQQGTLFANCYTPLARTAPSLVSLFTGTWPQRHGIRANFITDDETQLRVPTLPQILAKHGYETITISDWSGSDLKKFSFGFQHMDLAPDQWNLKYLIRQGPKDIRLFLSLFTHNQLGKNFLPEIYYLAGVPLTQHLGHQTRRWLNRFAKDGKPFLLNVFMATTHPPFGSEYPYYTRFSNPSYKGESKFGMSRLTDPFEIIRSQREPKEAFDLEQIIDLYDGCVRNFDDEVRHIIHHLRACNLENNTIIIIYSDHGMEFFEHDTWGQGNSVLGNASAHVPLIIVDPRRIGRNKEKRVTRTIDLFPTLLDLCGLPIPDEVQGVSLLPYLDGKEQNLDLTAYFETGIWLTSPPGLSSRHISYPDLFELLEIPDIRKGTLAIKHRYRNIIIDARDRMLRRDRWKLVRYALKQNAEYHLFDMDHDPECRRNVADKNPTVLKKLIQDLEAWLAVDKHA